MQTFMVIPDKILLQSTFGRAPVKRVGQLLFKVIQADVAFTYLNMYYRFVMCEKSDGF